jgi:hypothetical protein
MIVEINKKVNILYKIVILLLIINFLQFGMHLFSRFGGDDMELSRKFMRD